MSFLEAIAVVLYWSLLVGILIAEMCFIYLGFYFAFDDEAKKALARIAIWVLGSLLIISHWVYLVHNEPSYVKDPNQWIHATFFTPQAITAEK